MTVCFFSGSPTESSVTLFYTLGCSANSFRNNSVREDAFCAAGEFWGAAIPPDATRKNWKQGSCCIQVVNDAFRLCCFCPRDCQNDLIFCWKTRTKVYSCPALQGPQNENWLDRSAFSDYLTNYRTLKCICGYEMWLQL